MADQYMFVASGDACGVCSGMNGMTSDEPIALPHDNCMCQVIPLGDGDCPTYEASGASSHHYGPHGSSFTVGVELSVHCCDGSEIGESVEIDMGNEDAYGDDIFQAIDDRIEGEAESLASQCPAGGPDGGSSPNVA
jgi:hypothetical protein